MLLLNPDRTLTDEGWLFISQHGIIGNRNRNQINALLRGYAENMDEDWTQSGDRSLRAWRVLEILVTEQIRRTYDSQPIDGFNGFYLGHNNQGNGNQEVFIVINKSINQILTFLDSEIAEAHRTTEDNEEIRSYLKYINGAAEPSQTIGVIREKTVMELLIESIRERDLSRLRTPNVIREPEDAHLKLADAYFSCHHGYVGADKSDPLQLLSAADIMNNACVVTPVDFDLVAFQLLSFLHLGYVYSSERQTSRQLLQSYEICRRDLAEITGLRREFGFPGLELAYKKPFEWFNFLFKTTGSRVYGNGFVANFSEHLDSSLVEPPRRCGLGPRDDESSLKFVRSKIPDIIQIFPSRRIVEVLDPSYRWNVPWHNFKSQVYCEVFRILFPGYTVTGEDFVDAINRQLH